MTTAEERIAILEEYTLLLTARVAELETLFRASASKLGEIIAGVRELKRLKQAAREIERHRPR